MKCLKKSSRRLKSGTGFLYPSPESGLPIFQMKNVMTHKPSIMKANKYGMDFKEDF